VTRCGETAEVGSELPAGDHGVVEAVRVVLDLATVVRILSASKSWPRCSATAKYPRLMAEAGEYHNSALCHVATILLIRIAAC
jgi:hypothetical protein